MRGILLVLEDGQPVGFQHVHLRISRANMLDLSARVCQGEMASFDIGLLQQSWGRLADE